MDEPYIAISALQHYAFCPRQFALIHVEQNWEENFFTADGQQLHERIESGVVEQRNTIRYERSVALVSHALKIIGKSDLVEIHGKNPMRFVPVEYKRGKEKIEDWDRIQLCAQALCIEEMNNTAVPEGYFWYWKDNKRTEVLFDPELRIRTISVIQETYELLTGGCTPPPINDKKRCANCSLVQICQPAQFRSDCSTCYIEDLFANEKVT